MSIGGWNAYLDFYLQRSRVEEICAALGAHRVHVGLLVRREADVLHVVRELLGHDLNQTCFQISHVPAVICQDMPA